MWNERQRGLRPEWDCGFTGPQGWPWPPPSSSSSSSSSHLHSSLHVIHRRSEMGRQGELVGLHCNIDGISKSRLLPLRPSPNHDQESVFVPPPSSMGRPCKEEAAEENNRVVVQARRERGGRRGGPQAQFRSLALTPPKNSQQSSSGG